MTWMGWSGFIRVFALAVACGVSATIATAGDFSVGYVQSALLLKESPQIEQLKKRVAQEFASREDRLMQVQARIAGLQQKASQEGMALDNAQARELRDRIGVERLKYQHARDELTQDKQLRYAEEQGRVQRVIQEVVAQVAQDQRLDMVLQSGAVWVSPKVDITQQVLERLRRMAEDR